jgi:hypothetical protein
VNLSVRAGLSGVVAAGAALGVAEVVAVATGPLTAPLLAVGGVVVDSVPGPVKDFGVQVFGVHDKTALITGTALLLAAYAFVVGLIARRHWRVALVGIALFGLVGVAAAMTRHDASALAALPSLIGAGLAVPVLRYLLGVAEPARADGPEADGGTTDETGRGSAVGPRDTAYVLESRRRFLKAVGVAAGVAAVGGLACRCRASRRRRCRPGCRCPARRPTSCPTTTSIGSTPRSTHLRWTPRPGS